jgi:hypothetical protein
MVGVLFILPWVIGFMTYYAKGLYDTVILAFSNVENSDTGGFITTFNGIENFKYAFVEDPQFTQTLITGIGELIFEVPAILLFSLFMAVLLNQKMAGRAAFRAIFFLPVVLSTGIMESIEAGNILGSYMGESSGIDDGSGSSAASEIVSALDIEQLFSNMQTILTDIENLNFTLAEVNAHIKSGLLYYDEDSIPVYGLEIGQKNTIDGEEVFSKFARFTADRLSFYDQNDMEVAYISDYKLYITHVQIKGSLQEGGYKDFVDDDGGIITRWVGW